MIIWKNYDAVIRKGIIPEEQLKAMIEITMNWLSENSDKEPDMIVETNNNILFDFLKKNQIIVNTGADIKEDLQTLLSA